MRTLTQLLLPAGARTRDSQVKHPGTKFQEGLTVRVMYPPHRHPSPAPNFCCLIDLRVQ